MFVLVIDPMLTLVTWLVTCRRPSSSGAWPTPPVVDWSTGLRDRLWLSLTINVSVTLVMLFFVWGGAGSILAWGLRKASAATDQQYREAFYEPLLSDVRASLAARQVYLARRADAS